MNVFSRALLVLVLVAQLATCVFAQGSSPTLVSPQFADTWAATDALGRELPGNAETGDLDREKYVGIFYFTWLGAHGHDAHSGPTADEGIHPRQAGVTYKSPYDISKILLEHPDDPQYGPELAFHHWGEPYFGYYLSDDEWVIVKHAQLLSDAGVDVIVFDITNAVVYLPQALKICTIFSRLQQQGWAVPRVAFLTNSRHVETTEKLFEGFYRPGLYQDLWFQWKGKPLLMGNPEGLSEEITDFFNFRRSWAWTDNQEWFGDGRDKWPWIDHYPQNYGWHDDPETPEQIVVSTAQHPVSNIGRSFHDGAQPAPEDTDPGAGWFFAEQWKRALEVDPEFIFITGWNEWVAMRFTDGKAKKIMGKPIEVGETYFVDQYNEEFSRDIEPMKGGFGDNYYYQMIDGIRRFKGTRPVTEMSSSDLAALPRVPRNGLVAIDGTFDDWSRVSAIYYDHYGDTLHRNTKGWGRIESYKDASGRHDLLEARMVDDGDYLYCYLRTAEPFADANFPEGLELFLSVGSASDEERNLGYTHRVLSKTTTAAPDAGFELHLEKAEGDWEWKTIATVSVKVSENELELTIPLSQLGGPTGEVQFKWSDNARPAGDAMRFMAYGDSAPNARFNYRYQLTTNQ